MNRTGPSINRGDSKQDYATPPGVVRACEEKFGQITFDLAAHAGNAKHTRYFTEKDNSLVQDWHKIPGVLWLNPPYNDIGAWAEKCWIESQLGAKVLFLVPASVGANWYRDFVHGKATVYFMNGRIKFAGPDADPYPKDCLVAAYGVVGQGDWGGSLNVWAWPYQNCQWEVQPMLEDVI